MLFLYHWEFLWASLTFIYLYCWLFCVMDDYTNLQAGSRTRFCTNIKLLLMTISWLISWESFQRRYLWEILRFPIVKSQCSKWIHIYGKNSLDCICLTQRNIIYINPFFSQSFTVFCRNERSRNDRARRNLIPVIPLKMILEVNLYVCVTSHFDARNSFDNAKK